MTSIKASMAALKVQAAQIAKLSGDPNLLATQEVNAAMKAGTITKAQRDLLQRALSDGGADVASVTQTLDKYEQAFEKADTNGDGSIQKAERISAEQNWQNWMALAASPNVPQAEKDAAKGQTVQVEWTTSSGRHVSSPINNPNSLLQKVDRVVQEADASLFASNAAALRHQTAKQIAQNLV